jgi:hypothetical protein
MAAARGRAAAGRRPAPTAHEPAQDPGRPVRLSRGRHSRPSAGTCLMELASLRAGEPWSDRPVCVHPVLAAVARAVNDRVSDDARGGLAALVPLLIGTAGAGPQASPRLVLLCAGAALKHGAPMRHELASARRVARYVLSRTAPARQVRGPRCAWPFRAVVAILDRAGLLDRAYAYEAGLQVSQAVALIAGEGGDTDRELRLLLQACASACAAAIHPDQWLPPGGRGGSTPRTPSSPTCSVHLVPSQ